MFEETLSYDDVLLVPGYSEILPRDTDVSVRLGPGSASVFYNTLPLYGAILGFAVLGEPITIYHVFGGMLIIGGGIWAARHRSPAG